MKWLFNMLHRKCHGLLVSAQWGSCFQFRLFPTKRPWNTTPIATTCIRKQTKISGNGRTRELQNHTVPASTWQSVREKSKTSQSIQLIKTQYLKTALKTCIVKYQCNGCLECLVRQGFNLFYGAEYQLLLCLGRSKKIHLKGILLYSVQLCKCKA